MVISQFICSRSHYNGNFFNHFFIFSLPFCWFTISDVRCKYFCCVCISLPASHIPTHRFFACHAFTHCCHAPFPSPQSAAPSENGRQSRVQWRIFHHHASVSDAAASVSLTMFQAARVCVCICMNEYTTHYIRVHIYMELCFSGICTLAAYLSCFWHLLNGNRKRLSDQLGAHQRKWMKYQT